MRPAVRRGRAVVFAIDEFHAFSVWLARKTMASDRKRPLARRLLAFLAGQV
jgi:hypothetical protein